MTYHRFTQHFGNPEVTLDGIFQIGIKIWKSYKGKGNDEKEENLDLLMKSLNHYLITPKNIPEYGIFWFKKESRCINLAIELCQVLNKFDIKTAHFISDNPGKILYEDKHQIIASWNRRAKCIKINCQYFN